MRLAAAMLAILGALIGGCNKNKERKGWRPEEQPVAKAEPPKETPNTQPEPKKQPRSLLGNIRRRAEDLQFDNAMRNIGLAVQSYQAEKNRLPTKLAELGPQFENNREVKEAFEWLEVQWGAPPPSDPAGTMFAYEIAPDATNHRAVVFANGTYRKVPEEEFAKMPKAQGKK